MKNRFVHRASLNIIELNKRVHNNIAGSYEESHSEIFNTPEQTRLRLSLVSAAEFIASSSDVRNALDYGCGSGNLTKHLLDLGFSVVSMDISEKFLSLIGEKFAGNNRSTVLLANGFDLTNLPTDSVDFVATYSVLHHVPDYLTIVREMARVTRKGGVIYIDHECNPSYWKGDSTYTEFCLLAAPRMRKSLKRFLQAGTYRNKLKSILYPRFQPEGDIHVWPDDHVEWDKITLVLKESGCEIVKEEDYLLFRTGYPESIYQSYCLKCSDMKVLIARKK